MKIEIRELRLNDLELYKKWNNPNLLHNEFDGPYYPRKTVQEIDLKIIELKKKILSGEKAFTNRKFIVNSETGNIVGSVNFYYKSKETNWIEVGITIYDESLWGKGIGYIVLKEWINEVFETHPMIVRIGLSTWSGNYGMIKLSKKLGLKKEAEYKQARIVKGKYYDSISYGILRSDWFKI